ncbi:MAG: DUF4340 domain-containing protein [Bacteroidales bacterium]|nr:DUF4340 domain-containing protein [Bacteroidales bacterium]
MKRNKLILTLTFVLIVIAAFLYFGKQSGTFKSKEKDFAVKDTASITKIFLADKLNKTVLLERVSSSEWTLNSTYKARQSGINLLLETIKYLVPKYPVPQKAHDNIVSQLAAQSIKVEIYQKVYRIDLFDKIKLFEHEKLTKVYYLGGATPDNMGTFMLNEGADTPFVVHLLGFRGFVAPRYSTQEKDWRDHSIFKTRLYDVRSVVMEMPGDPENSFRVESSENNITLFRLQDNQMMAYDTLRLLNFLTSFADIRFEALLDMVEKKRRDSIIHSTPKNILTLIDVKGDTTSIKTFFKPNDDRAFDMEGNIYTSDVDRMYALVNEERDFVLIQYYLFDKVLRPLSYFIPED